MKVPLADWKCSDKEREYVNQVLDSGWLTYGPFCKKLEGIWSKYHNCEYGVVNSSGTAALQLAFRSMKELYKWKDDAEVIVPAVTFPATINMVIESGLKPVFCDVKESDGMIDIEDMEKRITPKTKAVCVVHLWGTAYPRKKALLELCERYNLKIVEDSCETIDKNVGDWGDVSCFSMYFNHIISAGVGGMACTNNPDLEYLMRSYANHGMIDVHASPKYKRFSFARVGYSMRITEMEAALGVAQWEKIDKILKRRKELSNMLFNGLHKMGFSRRAQIIGGTMMFPMILRPEHFYDARQFLEIMEENGVETRTMLPITNQPVFKPYLTGNYPIADKIAEFGVFLPIHPTMKKCHIDKIIKAVGVFRDFVV